MGRRYGFVVYMDPTVTDVACAGLNGMRMGERTLTVRRATEVISFSEGWNFNEFVCLEPPGHLITQKEMLLGLLMKGRRAAGYLLSH